MTSFSVIIPTRGRHRFLKQAISSVLSQSHAASEIIIVDDGAGAGEAVGKMASTIIVLDNAQRGPVRARNLGVTRATCEVVAFLDDDDWWTDMYYLSKAAAIFDRGAAFCFADGHMAFEDGRPSLPFAFDANAKSLEHDNTILISAVAYRRSLHAGLGLFDESLPFYWDWDWHIRVARGSHPLTHIKSPVVAIRVHAQNMSGESLERQRRENLGNFAAKHQLASITLKNHLDIATHGPGTPA